MAVLGDHFSTYGVSKVDFEAYLSVSSEKIYYMHQGLVDHRPTTLQCIGLAPDCRVIEDGASQCPSVEDPARHSTFVGILWAATRLVLVTAGRELLQVQRCFKLSKVIFIAAEMGQNALYGVEGVDGITKCLK